jgi:hypothetical protein
MLDEPQIKPVGKLNTKIIYTSSQVKVKNIQAKVMKFTNFWQRDTTDCYVDVTLDALWNIDANNSPYDNSILLKQDRDQLSFRMLIESNDLNGCFPHRMQIDLMPRNILH